MPSLFERMEKSGHWYGVQVALGGSDERFTGNENLFGFEFSFPRDDSRPQRITGGRVQVSHIDGGMTITVDRAPADSWFRALGSLGTVGASGGDPWPTHPGYPQWTWQPAGQGLICGAIGGTLYPATLVRCTTRVQVAEEDVAWARASLYVEPLSGERYESAWGIGVQFLGVLTTGDMAFTVQEAQGRRIDAAVERCRAR